MSQQCQLQNLSPEEIRQCRECFEMYDLDGDGVISAREFRKVSHRLGYKLTEGQVEEIMRESDLDKSGTLNFEEFLLVMPCNQKIPKQEHRMADVRRKFLQYDTDGNGVVTADEAHEILRKELAFSPEQSKELVRRYDKNGDGQLDYEEFVTFYSKVKAKAAEVRDMFHHFDKDGSGSVSMDEAKQMLRQLEGMTDADVEKLVAMYDANKDGELQYEEFVSFLLHDS